MPFASTAHISHKINSVLVFVHPNGVYSLNMNSVTILPMNTLPQQTD